MNTIRFSKINNKPYDKLSSKKFQKGNLFTTFRAYTVKKDIYYSNSLNKEFFVVYEDRTIGKAILVNKEYRWSSDLTLEEIKRDTFEEWNRTDFEELLYKFYGSHKVFGFWLTFKITKVGEFHKTLDVLGEKNVGGNL